MTAMPGQDVLFSSVHTMAHNANVPLVNLYGEPDFLDEDFGDVDHLHPKGAGPTKVADKVLAKAGLRGPTSRSIARMFSG